MVQNGGLNFLIRILEDIRARIKDCQLSNYRILIVAKNSKYGHCHVVQKIKLNGKDQWITGHSLEKKWKPFDDKKYKELIVDLE